jgi:hypothetical protein
MWRFIPKTHAKIVAISVMGSMKESECKMSNASLTGMGTESRSFEAADEWAVAGRDTGLLTIGGTPVQ